MGSMYEGELASLLGFSWGKLSTHLSRLERTGYMRRRPVLTRERPRVLVEITERGAERLMRHLAALEEIYKRMRRIDGLNSPRDTPRDRPT